MTLRRAGSGPTVMALHGFTGTPEDWLPVADGWDLSAPWLPGHGIQTARRCTMQGTVEKLLTLMPARPWVLGYSMGARVALSVAVAAPHRVRGLVLVGGTAGLEGQEAAARRRADEALADRLERQGLDDFLKDWQEVAILRSQNNIRQDWLLPMRTRKQRHTTTGLAVALRGIGTGAMPSLWSSLPTLQVPALLITGANDPKFTDIAVRMSGLLPHAAALAVPGAGHCAHLEAPEVVRAAIDAFIASAPNLEP